MVKNRNKKVDNPRKPFYKKWWFIALVVLAAASGVTDLLGVDTDDTKPSEVTQEEVKKEIIEEVIEEEIKEEIIEEEITKEVKPEKKKSSEKEKKKEDRSKFYIIDNLVKDTNIGTEVMNINDYDGFAINGFLLEGAINKFGLPSHVIGSMEGDETMEVTYPSDEEGYSVGLIFEYKPSGFGDWKLKEKYVVETDGIGFSEYTKP